MRQSLILAFLTLLGATATAPADLVYFARGGQAQLVATFEGDRVRLETPDGPKVFPRSDFLAIVPESGPSKEWPGRRDSAKSEGSVEARFKAAWWALENGLTREAIASFDELRRLGSSHSPTRRVAAGLDALALPCPDPDLDRFRKRLRPWKFREARSAHVILFHQGDDALARERLDVLERVTQTFLLLHAAQGIALPAPKTRLVSVYFADRRDYVQFLRQADADLFAETQGYYHPTLNAVFAFDTRSSVEQQTGRRAIANRRKDGVAEGELARQALLLDLDWRSKDLGIAAHETVHQLTVETGLAPRFDDFPSWLHEGLAAQFEVVRGGRWAGVGRVHDLRLLDWRSIHPAPRLAPLVRDNGLGLGYRRDLYAESWALVYYLRKAHPREYLTFLDLLRTPRSASSPRGERTAEAFRIAFGGKLAELESSWHRYLAALKTPLEAARPVSTENTEGGEGSGPKKELAGPGTGH